LSNEKQDVGEKDMRNRLIAILVWTAVGMLCGAFYWLVYSLLIGVSNDYEMYRRFESVKWNRLLAYCIGGGVGALLIGIMMTWRSKRPPSTPNG
jgi:hypothetical protein